MIYGSANPSNIKLLDPVQNQAVRICLGAFRTSPAGSLYVEAVEPPLSLCGDKFALNYCLKFKSCP